MRQSVSAFYMDCFINFKHNLNPMKKSLLPWVCFGILFTSCTKNFQVQDNSPASPESTKLSKGSSGVVSYLTGDAADVNRTTTAGLLLMGGGTDVDNAFKWMIGKCGGGDVVIIRATGADGYNAYLFGLGNVNSVETLIIDSRTKAGDAAAIAKIKGAELLFIAGGDQWDYVNYWKDTPVEDAINDLINNKKIPVGGTSAGLAVMGAVYYSAQNGTVTSDKALADPYNKYMTLGKNDFVNAPNLENTITDSHYSQRSRMGRHIAFLARMMKDWTYTNVKGIGIDEETAVCVEANGIATVYGNYNAYFLRNNGAGPEKCLARNALTWNQGNQAVSVYTIHGGLNGNGSFNLATWTNASGGTSSFNYVNNGVLF